MKIAITGHTSGIGLALFNKFTALGHDVTGFSRTTGHDISLESSRNDILDQSVNFDLVVNNAYHEQGQNALLDKLLTRLNSTQYIINVSSNIVNVPELQTDELRDYKTSKQILNNTIANHQGSVKVLNVLPDIVNTNFFLGGDLLKQGMDPEYVADMIIEHIGKSTELVIKHPDWN